VTVLSIGDKRLGAVLLERGYVSDEALQQAISRHSEVGGRLGDVLVNIGVISEQRIARAVEESIGIPLVMLPRVDVMPEALAKLPADTAFELGALPFALDGNRLRVAFEDPLDALAVEEAEDASGCVVEPYQALQKELQWAIATYYPELGLEPPGDFHVDTSQRLGALAVERGFISEAQLQAAVDGAAADRRPARPHLREAGPHGRRHPLAAAGRADGARVRRDAGRRALRRGARLAPAAPRRGAVQRRAVSASTATRSSSRRPIRAAWATSRRSCRCPSPSWRRPRRRCSGAST
jgi:hypothetical protein